MKKVLTGAFKFFAYACGAVAVVSVIGSGLTLAHNIEKGIGAGADELFENAVALADGNRPANTKAEEAQICSAMALFAEASAVRRDVGEDQRAVIDDVDGMEAPARVKKVMRRLVDAAYKMPGLPPAALRRELESACVAQIRKASV